MYSDIAVLICLVSKYSLASTIQSSAALRDSPFNWFTILTAPSKSPCSNKVWAQRSNSKVVAVSVSIAKWSAILACTMSMVRRDWRNERRNIPRPPPSSGTSATRLQIFLTCLKRCLRLVSETMPLARASPGTVESSCAMYSSPLAASESVATSFVMSCFSNGSDVKFVLLRALFRASTAAVILFCVCAASPTTTYHCTHTHTHC